MIPPKSEISNCSKPHLLQFSLVGYTGADPYLLNRMLIIRGLADSFIDGCKIQKVARQANYSPYYKKSATVGVNNSLTITLSMVLKRMPLFETSFSFVFVIKLEIQSCSQSEYHSDEPEYHEEQINAPYDRASDSAIHSCAKECGTDLDSRCVKATFLEIFKKLLSVLFSHEDSYDASYGKA